MDGVAAGVPVKVAVGVAVAVPVGVGDEQPPSELNTSENLLTEPVSMFALSLTLSTHVPFAFSPSSSENIPVVSGEKLPDSGEPVTLVRVEMFGKPPSSFSVERQMFSR